MERAKPNDIERQIALSLHILAVSSALAMLAFSRAQRKWIRERDFNRCQFPHKHRCEGRLEVHHIKPQMWGREVEGCAQEELDVPENAITLCRHSHMAIVHMGLSYEDVMQRFRKGQKYWDDRYDGQFAAYAVEATEQYEVFEPFPYNE